MNLDINFNFYSGDFQSSESVSFTIIVAVVSIILTGIVTIISQRFYDNFKNCESSDLVFDYIHEEAKKLGNSALIQSDALIKITKSLKSEAVADYNIAKVTGFNVEQIKEWETVVFYNSIVFRRDASPDSLMKQHSDIKMAFNHDRGNIGVWGIRSHVDF